MGKTNHLHLEFFTGRQIIQSSLWSTSVDEFNDSAEIVLVGDFNLSDIDWSTVFRDTDLNCRLLDILLDHLMSQQVLEPTRGKNILDLVITTNEGLIRNLQVGEPFSDHNSIAFEVTMSFFVLCCNKFLRLRQIGSSNWKLIFFSVFRKYPVPSFDNIFVFVKYVQ